MMRRTPLKRTAGLARTTGVRQVSARRRKRDAGYAAARDAVLLRSGGRCEANVSPSCTRRCEQVHHRAGRGGPDPHALGNLVGLCLPCHEWVERHRTEAYANGLLLRRIRPNTPGST